MSIEALNTGQISILAQKVKLADKINEIKVAKTTDTLSVEKKAQIENASRGFESIFVNMMLKEMRKSLENNDEGFGGETMMELADLQLSEQISNRGRGIGIAEMVYGQLTGGEQLPMKNVFNSNSLGFFDRAKSRLENYNTFISGASEEFGIPEPLIKAIITAESAGKNDAISNAGAKGLMQLMDATAKDLGVKDSFNPKENIYGGTNYINQMLNKYNGDLNLALAAYNAGPGNVDKYNGIPPFNETKNYVSKVLEYTNLYR